MNKTRSSLRTLFSEADVNKNGSITRDEMMVLFMKMNIGLSENDIYDMIDYIDKDKSNSIDYHEFIA